MLGQLSTTAQSITHEWVVTSQFHSTFPNASPPLVPRHHQFRSCTPPSYSPSPTPSVASSFYSTDMVEIEELAEDYSDDSGIELLQGEFEEAPENYGQKQQNEMDSEEDEQEVLQRLRRLIASQHVEGNASLQAYGAAGRDGFITSALRKKRSFTESLDGSADDESDDRTDSSSGGRIRRRKLAPMRQPPPQQKRDTQDSSRSTPDFMMEMDL